MYKLTADGSFEAAPYDPSVLAFVHKDMEIRNPYISDCGRFDLDPVKDYGFEAVDTGGGCKALTKVVADDGSYLCITDSSGIAIPESADGAVIGRFDADGVQVAYCPLSEVPYYE